MKIAITGHTQGIGKEIAKYYQNRGAEIFGFSKSTGYDIGDSEVRKKIIEESKDCDIFVNNAIIWNDNSQTLMLKEIYFAWRNKQKIIINIGSVSGDFFYRDVPPFPNYSKIKHEQDIFHAQMPGPPFILNIRPGTIQTNLTKNLNEPKMDISSIVDVLEFIRSNKEKFLVKSITFIPNPNNLSI